MFHNFRWYTVLQRVSLFPLVQCVTMCFIFAAGTLCYTVFHNFDWYTAGTLCHNVFHNFR